MYRQTKKICIYIWVIVELKDRIEKNKKEEIRRKKNK